LVSNKYVVLCGLAGNLFILDLKKILNPPAENDHRLRKDLELFSIQSGIRFFWDSLLNEPVPNPSLQTVGEQQIGLAIQVPGNDYALYTFDLIGDWGTVERVKRRRMFSTVSGSDTVMVEPRRAFNTVLYGIM